MSDAVGTIEQLAGELARVFQPLTQQGKDQTLHLLPEWLGLRASDVLIELRDLAAKLSATAATAMECAELARTLTAAIARGDKNTIVFTSAAILNSLGTLIQSLRDTATALEAAANSPRLTPQQQSEIRAFASTFVERLLQRLLVEYIQTRFPHITQWLIATGVIEVIREEGGPEGSLNCPYDRKSFHVERVPRLLSNPITYFRGIYKWGDSEFDGLALFAMLQSLLNEQCQIPAEIIKPRGAPSILEAFGFSAEVNPSLNPPGLNMSIRIPISVDESATIDEQEWQVTIKTRIVMDADVELTIRPFCEFAFNLPQNSSARFHFSADFRRSSMASPVLLLGTSGGSRIEILSPAASVQVDLDANATAPRAIFDPEGSFSIGGGKAILDLSSADSFLLQAFRTDCLTIPFDLVGVWSLAGGLRLHGGAGLEATLPVNLSLLDGIEIDSLYLALGVNEKKDPQKGSAIEAITAATVKIKLGPVSAVVEQFGLEATLSFPEKGGNLGVANLDLGFKSPKGVGLSINAQAVTGSGYLSYDSDTEQYTGLLQLEIAEKISLSAVGLLTTRMPNGSKGYSLLVLLSTWFEPGIQLGYGFVLRGLGGLVGVNRTVSVDVLRDGLHRGVFNSILFPQNIVEQAPQIVSNLGTIFPPAQDRFLFGPMAIIEWGGAIPLVTMELGVMLEAPEPVRAIMVGRLRIFLPRNEESAPIKLQLDALGVIDFQSGNIALDAVLYDSVIGPYVVTGEMALRANFGAQPMFVLSVGGFHPAFQVPAGFPSLERVTFTLAKKAGVEVRLQLSAYFALTSNTIQFGAHLDLWAKVGIFKLSGELGFDALIHLNPFGLVASFEGAVTVRVGDRVLMGVTLQMNLTGPSPWYGWGKARFRYLFGSVTKEFDVQVGQEVPLQPPPPIHAAQVLREELGNPGNWSSQLPAGANPLVTFRGDGGLPKDATGQPRKKVLVHPLAEVQVSQRRVPLVGPDEAITQFGNTTPEGDTTFALTGRVSSDADAAGDLSTSPVSDWFAPAEFYAMSDAEKLSAPSFELKPSGIRFQYTGRYSCGNPVCKPLLPATTTDPTRADQHPLSTTMLSRVAAWGAAGQTLIRASGSAKYRHPSGQKRLFALEPSTYCVGVREGKGPEKRSLTYTAAQVQARLMRNAQPQALAAVVPDIGIVE